MVEESGPFCWLLIDFPSLLILLLARIGSLGVLLLGDLLLLLLLLLLLWLVGTQVRQGRILHILT